MAGSALFRGGLVEQYRLAGNYFRQLVAFRTAHILMGSLERKVGPLVVVKQSRLPFHGVVAIDAARDIGLGELFAMNVFMAVLALHRCDLEIDVNQLGLKVRRLVAVHARGSAMRPN